MFHIRVAATGNARSPTVDNCVRQTISELSEDDLEPRCRKASGVSKYSLPSYSTQYRSFSKGLAPTLHNARNNSIQKQLALKNTRFHNASP